MNNFLRRSLPALLALSAIGAQGQFYKLHGASVSVGGFGQFNRVIESDTQPRTAPFTTPFVGTTTETGQNQYTTQSAGGIASLQFHPVSWAGVELNYAYSRYSELYTYSYANAPGTIDRSRIPTNQHEATGAYLFHPRHIPFQPFMGIGGGAVDFNPAFAAQTGGIHQWRGAGLLEAGFDLPTVAKHIAFRVEGRSLYYRAPDFGSSTLSTRSWRVQAEPVVSAVYRF
jgi:hypothetical protein